jgi:Brp/Blh family beta-carotene 15,15'-monooxygenase
VLTTLLNRDLPLLSPALIKQLILLLTLIVIGGLSLLASRLPRNLLVKEYASLLMLGVMFWHTPLFLGFAVYFALWHALPSALDQITFLWQQKTSTTLWKYGKAVLPFSLLSLLALGIVGWYLPAEELSLYWSWLFVFIAAVTLPHMLLLDRVYQRLLSEE